MKVFMWEGPGQRKNWLHLGEDPDHMLDRKKNSKFSETPMTEVCALPVVSSC